MIGMMYRKRSWSPVLPFTRGSRFHFNGRQIPSTYSSMIDDFLESEAIRRMDCQVRSAELYSVEHVWDDMGRAIVRMKICENA